MEGNKTRCFLYNAFRTETDKKGLEFHLTILRLTQYTRSDHVQFKFKLLFPL